MITKIKIKKPNFEMNILTKTQENIFLVLSDPNVNLRIKKSIIQNSDSKI